MEKSNRNVKETSHYDYIKFLAAYDEVELTDLSDEDLQSYHDLCVNGEIVADEELRKRGL